MSDRVISFALWGNDPKYLQGAIANALLVREIYPKWDAIFFIADNVVNTIKKTIENCDHAVRDFSHISKLKRLVRLLPVCEGKYEYIITRDVDSRLNIRERDAVSEWIKSGKNLHTIKDYKFHTVPMMGGLSGFRKNALQDLKENMDKFTRGNPKNKYSRFEYSDQSFLGIYYAHLLKEHLFVHSWKPKNGECPLRTKLLNNHFCGQQYKTDGTGIWP